MSSKYINNSSYASSGYTLSGAFQAITIGPKGTIGGTGVIGGTKEAYTIANAGHIAGKAYGVLLQDGGSVTNTNSITAGTIGIYIHGSATGGATVKNSGKVISRDLGVYITTASAGYVSNSGAGALIESSTFAVYLNRGEVVNRAVIEATNTYARAVQLGSGLFINSGAGAVIESGFGFVGISNDVVENSGTIISTFNGTYNSGNATKVQYGLGTFLLGGGSVTNSAGGLIEATGSFGIGVWIDQTATVTNFGTIAGSTAAPSSTAGGGAVKFTSATDVLIDEAGSTFIGRVMGGGGELELAGTPGALNGLGTNFSDFGTVDVLAGANWTLTGTNVVASGTTSHLVDDGGLTLTGTSTIAGTVSGSGVLILDGANTVIRSGSVLSVSRLVESGGAAGLGTSLEYDGGFTETGGVFRLGGDTLTLTNGVVFTGGAMVGSGTLSTTGTTSLAALTVDGGAVWDDAKIVTASGSLKLGASGSGGTLVDAAGAVFDLAANVGIAVASGGTGTVVVQGLLEKTGGTGTSTIAAAVSETGTISIATGTLDLTGSTSVLDGTVSGAGTLQLGGGTTLLEGSLQPDVSHIRVTGGTTELDGLDLSYDGNFVESGGTIQLTRYFIELFGANDFTGGTISGSGYLDTYGTNTSLGRLTLQNGAGWQVFGTVTSTGVLVMGNAALGLTVEGNGVFGITGSGGIVRTGANGSIDNAGLLEKTVNTGLTTIAAPITDTGTISIATGTLDFTGVGNSFQGGIGGAGTLEFSAGNDTLAGNARPTVAHLTLAGAATELILGVSLAYAGSFTQSAGTLNLGGNTLSLSGKSSLAGAVTGAGTLTLAGTETLATGAVLSVSHVTLSGGSVTLAKNLTYNGSFVQTAGPIKVTGDTLVLNGSDTLANGAISGAGFLATYGAVALTNYTINAGATWQVCGTAMAAASITLGNAGGGSGRLAVETGGVYDITGNGGIVVAPGGSGTVGNFALFEKAGGTGISTIAAAFTNSGTIQVTAGALDLSGAVDGTGHATIGAAGVLRFDGTVASTQTIAFAGTTGGRLALNDPSGTGLGFEGSVTGFSGKDQLDLTTFAFSGNPTIGWSQTSASSGILTVTDGSSVAHITLFGQYVQAGFGKAKDGGSGTNITYTTPAQVALAMPHH